MQWYDLRGVETIAVLAGDRVHLPLDLVLQRASGTFIFIVVHGYLIFLKMHTEAIKSIVNGTEKKGINKYMLEEVYFSSLCEDSLSASKYNPQNAHFQDGRYYFDFPDLWYNNLSNNKAIGLRRIDLYPDPLNIEFRLILNRMMSGKINTVIPLQISMTIAPNQSMNSILEEICRQATKFYSATGMGSARLVDREKTCKFVANYHYATSTGSIEAVRNYVLPEGEDEKYHFSLRIDKLNNDAKMFFNIKNGSEFPGYIPLVAGDKKDGTMKYELPGMWNREFLFVHASFVNGTSFNYLGRSGEFYPKPSKMYKFAGGSNRFYFELSYDGRTPITDKVADFCIDLAYIYYDKHYNAQ